MASETSFGQPNGNPPGRPPGTKNKIGRDFQEAYEEAIRQGYKHPFLVMTQWAHDETKPLEVRAAMLKECASYTCTKPKITVRSEVPVLTSLEQAESFLGTIAAENDLDPVELANVVKHFIESKRAGDALKIKQLDDPNTLSGIRIDGGLPDLRGTNVLMPTTDDRGRPLIRNGHNGHTIDHVDTPALDQKESIG